MYLHVYIGICMYLSQYILLGLWLEGCMYMHVYACICMYMHVSSYLYLGICSVVGRVTACICGDVGLISTGGTLKVWSWMFWFRTAWVVNQSAGLPRKHPSSASTPGPCFGSSTTMPAEKWKVNLVYGYSRVQTCPCVLCYGRCSSCCSSCCMALW